MATWPTCSPKVACAYQSPPTARFGRATAVRSDASPLNQVRAVDISSGSDADRARVDTRWNKLGHSKRHHRRPFAGATYDGGTGSDRIDVRTGAGTSSIGSSCFFDRRKNLLKRTYQVHCGRYPRQTEGLRNERKETNNDGAEIRKPTQPNQ